MNRNDWLHKSPKEFRVIGSNDDCGKTCAHGVDCIAWTTLLSVKNAGFTETNQLKTWYIPPERRQKFACMGIKVFSTNNDNYVTNLAKIPMWTGQSQMEKIWEMHGVTILSVKKD